MTACEADPVSMFSIMSTLTGEYGLTLDRLCTRLLGKRWAGVGNATRDRLICHMGALRAGGWVEERHTAEGVLYYLPAYGERLAKALTVHAQALRNGVPTVCKVCGEVEGEKNG